VKTLIAFTAAGLVATTVHAAGLAVRWGTCLGDGGIANRSFACDTNAGSERLLASFAIPYDLSYLPHGYESVIDVATAGAALSPWWSPGCRGGSITFADNDAPPCAEITGGEGSIAVASFVASRGPNAVRFEVRSTLVNPPRFGFVIHEVEYGMFRIDLDHARTVGAGACGGCSTPACIVFNSLRIFSSLLSLPPEITLSGAGFGPGTDFVTWQGGAGVQVGPAFGCPAATPARNRTWSDVKAIYR